MKKIMLLIGIAFFNIVQALPSPYNELEEVLPFNPHGWYGHAAIMENLISTYNIQTVVEVGSWMGASTRHIASILPPNGKIYAIDHWLGSIENQPGHDAWHPILPQLYEQFLSNIIHAGLTDKVIPLRMSSLEAAKQFTILPDLVYLDGSHDTASVYADLCAWYPFVKGHGIICGDDWGWDTVQLAVRRFARKNKLTIITPGSNYWQLVE